MTDPLDLPISPIGEDLHPISRVSDGDRAMRSAESTQVSTDHSKNAVSSRLDSDLGACFSTTNAAFDFAATARYFKLSADQGNCDAQFYYDIA